MSIYRQLIKIIDVFDSDVLNSMEKSKVSITIFDMCDINMYFYILSKKIQLCWYSLVPKWECTTMVCVLQKNRWRPGSLNFWPCLHTELDQHQRWLQEYIAWQQTIPYHTRQGCLCPMAMLRQCGPHMLCVQAYKTSCDKSEREI